MKLYLYFLSLAASLSTAVPSYADMVYLKNGRSLECFFKSEDEKSIELEVKGGVVKFERDQVVRIDKSTPEESAAIRNRWERDRIAAQARKIKQEAEEKTREETRPREIEFSQDSPSIVLDVRLNRKLDAKFVLDTGATMTVVSKVIAKKLGYEFDKDKSDIKLQVADGRQIEAKKIVLNSIIIQGVEANDIESCVILDDKLNAAFGDGLLGMSFLKKFNIKVDHKTKKVILEKI